MIIREKKIGKFGNFLDEQRSSGSFQKAFFEILKNEDLLWRSKGNVPINKELREPLKEKKIRHRKWLNARGNDRLKEYKKNICDQFF